jgi:predicted TIM-barrel fold metal-dependent hydrolase
MEQVVRNSMQHGQGTITGQLYPLLEVDEDLNRGGDFTLMELNDFLARNYRIVDCHAHVRGTGGKLDVENCDIVIEAADALGIGKLCVSRPISGGSPTPEDFRAHNDVVIQAIERYPDRFLGYAYVNPGYSREAMEEMDRCIGEHGMIGIKLYNQYHICDPAVYPVIEKAIEMNAIILSHAGKTMDPSSKKQQPFISDGTHFAKAAALYPEAKFIQGHIGGGGDWEWSIKAIKSSPNVRIDTSGSVVDDRMIDMAVQELGVERILFATDMTFEGGIGKILGADLTEEERQLIFSGNFYNLLERRS